MSENTWQMFDLAKLKKKVEGREPQLHEFLRGPTLSGAIYRLPAGSRDMQAPHFEDEIYFVLEGRARLRVGAEEQEARPGMLLFVRATAEHSFFDIEEDLTLVAVFGNAARSRNE